jgi:hypothetical protein
MNKIRIIVEEANISMTAELNDSQTAKAIRDALPIEGHAQTWGEEVYFETPVKMPEEKAHAEVPSGTLAYWVPGHAFCIFFGQEPFSPVNVIGKVNGDPKHFAAVKSGQKIRVEHADEASKPKSAK